MTYAMAKTKDDYPEACMPPGTCGYCMTCKEAGYTKALSANPSAVWAVESPIPTIPGARKDGRFHVDAKGSLITEQSYDARFSEILTSLGVPFRKGAGIYRDVFFVPLSERRRVLARILELDKKPFLCLKAWVESSEGGDHAK